MSQPTIADPTDLAEGVVLIGHPFAETGMGEAARSLARSAVAAGIPTSVHHFDNHSANLKHSDDSLRSLATDRLDRQANIFCINADSVAETVKSLGAAALKGRVNVIRPFWELSAIRPAWAPPLTAMDEIWAASAFVQAAFEPSVKVPVVRIPLAVSLPEVVEQAVHLPGIRRRQRSTFGLPEHDFLFLFAFNMSSFPARKNPLALIDAFIAAFGGSPGTGVGLVLKTMGGQPGGDPTGSLADRARGDRRIHIIDETLTRNQTVALFAACNSFVSLHRSEGFGLGIAEAMLLGKPVIATDYSGSTDFLSRETGFPVPYRLVEVKRGEYPFIQPGQLWAEPDTEAAAALMRQVFEDPAHAATVAAAGRDFVRRVHSHEAVGRVVRKRLEDLGVLSPA